MKPGRLVDEIAAIESKVDAHAWKAIDAVRHVANTGAHMEKNINHDRSSGCEREFPRSPLLNSLGTPVQDAPLWVAAYRQKGLSRSEKMIRPKSSGAWKAGWGVRLADH